MMEKENPLGDMEPYEYADAEKVQEKLIDLGVPAILAEHWMSGVL